jgi:hypothetical protein
MKCKNDKGRVCGAGWRNNVFNLDGVKPTPKPPYKAIYGESSLGCFKDAGNRDLPNLLRAGYGRPDRCFKLAMDAGY